MGHLVEAELVLVLVLYLGLPPGVPQRVHQAPTDGGPAEVHQPTGQDEQGGQQQVVVESLHSHRGNRACNCGEKLIF